MKLPVYEIADSLIAALRGDAPPRILLKAPTGSGKSTSVPSILLDSGKTQGAILVVEPRRMAARLLADWVASQRQSPLGHEVGYAVRFDSKYQKSTRIIYLTDGVFQRWLQDNPTLSGVGAVVFDEFHERRLNVDIALGRCLNLQESSRPDLQVVVMSATLNTAHIAEFLQPNAILETQGRTFPVEVFYRPDRPPTLDRRSPAQRETPIWDRVTDVCREALQSDQAGNLLVFLPGNHEIRKTISALESAAFTKGWDLFPLHSSLPPAAQNAAIQPSSKPKIIVATNVAETSLTIDGVRTVIDAGLARSALFDTQRGINTLLIQKISRAAADQRAGRAGRTAPGRAFRLWSESEHARRPESELPEVHRVDLAESILLLKAAGIDDVSSFRWLDMPKEASIHRATALLESLGAISPSGQLSAIGTAMAHLPLEPRFSRLILAGHEWNCLSETAFIAAAVQSEGIFLKKSSAHTSRKDFIYPDDSTDFEGEWRAFESAQQLQFDPKRCNDLSIHARGARETAQTLDRLIALAERAGMKSQPIDFATNATAVGKAMLVSFNDHLGIRFNQGTLACRLVHKKRGKLDPDSCVKQAPAFVAAEITEVEAKDISVHLRRATAIDPSWLAELFPNDISTFNGAAWDETRRRVISRKETRFRDLILETKDSDHHVPLDQAAEILASHVLSGALPLKYWDHSVEQWTQRLTLLGATMPELDMPSWHEEDRIAAISQICHGAVCYKDIKDAPVWNTLREWLSPTQQQALDAYCPEHFKLPNGNSAKITYELGKAPYFSARVSHLFGVWKTPTIINGNIPLLVHILTPGQKPWQTTQDLEGFWSNGYFQMKKEIAGRYPKHPWPDDPKKAVPPR